MNHIPDTPDKGLDLTYRADLPKAEEGEKGRKREVKQNALEISLNTLKNNLNRQGSTGCALIWLLSVSCLFPPTSRYSS